MGTRKKAVAKPVTRDEVIELAAETARQAVQHYAKPTTNPVLDLSHWDAPLFAHTSDMVTTLDVSELADRARTLKALGYSLEIAVREDSTRGTLYIPSSKPEALIFRAVKKG